MQDLSSVLKKNIQTIWTKKRKKEKKRPWLLVLQLKMSSWPCNKSHGVVMCLLITLRCITVIHTLIYSPGPSAPAPPKKKKKKQTNKQPFLLYHIHSIAPHLPSVSVSIIHCRWYMSNNPLKPIILITCLGSNTEHNVCTEKV